MWCQGFEDFEQFESSKSGAPILGPWNRHAGKHLEPSLTYYFFTLTAKKPAVLPALAFDPSS